MIEMKFYQDMKDWGWNVMFVNGDGQQPAFIYTTGLYFKFKHPEIVISGNTNLASIVYYLVHEYVQKGQNLIPNKSYSNIILKYDVIFREVKQTEKSSKFYLLWKYYRTHYSEDPKIIQLVFPDLSGKFPNEKGYNKNFGQEIF